MSIERHEARDVVIVLIDGFSMMSFACVIEPMRAANLLAGRELYRCRLVSPLRTATASNGISIATELLADSGTRVNTVMVCAAGNPTTFRHRGTIAWLRRAARDGARIGGVSGAPFIMAWAGLLSGYGATIHWEHVPAFRDEFPHIELRQTLFEIDGGRLTCGGGVAALDMMHALIEIDHGATLAARVSDWFLQTDIRGGSGLQRLAPGRREGSLDLRLNAALAAMQGDAEGRLDTPTLEASTGLSRRQVERLFRAELGTSPVAFRRRQQLERARVMLVQSELPMIDIALQCGFATASHFSRSFRASFGCSPTEARRRNQ